MHLYEYKSEIFNVQLKAGITQFEKSMNQHGHDGWEVEAVLNRWLTENHVVDGTNSL